MSRVRGDGRNWGAAGEDTAHRLPEYIVAVGVVFHGSYNLLGRKLTFQIPWEFVISKFGKYGSNY